MFDKKTEELEQELQGTHPSQLSDYLNANHSELRQDKTTFSHYMKEKIKEKKIQKQQVFLQADIPLRYGYKLLSEEKVTRQRDVILRICYAAGFTLQEAQQALKLYRMNPLYARDARDAFLMICFNTRPGTVHEVNDLLVKNNLPALKSSGTQE